MFAQVTIPEPVVQYGLYAIGALGSLLLIVGISQWLIRRLLNLLPQQWLAIYHQVVKPDLLSLGFVLVAIAGDLVWLNLPINYWWYLAEIGLGLVITITLILLGSRLSYRLFDQYLLDVAIQSGRKINSELLLVTRFISNGLFVIVVVVIFAQIHNINIIGLLASLGVGGLAIAFAAQKTLEQILGGIVLFLDRPFVVDDYIRLPDETFGRVESIGLRSTKIRSSGKGTLVIVPNSTLASSNIENFTSTKKVISLFYLRFSRLLTEDDKAFVKQIILGSTEDILGIDPRSTDVKFHALESEQNLPQTQAHIYFFILGTGSTSMDLRQQVLDIATQNVTRQLLDYGIDFTIEENKVNVESPITI